MTQEWDYAVASEPLDFISRCNARHRGRILSVLQRIVANPAVEPDGSFYDRAGREVRVVRLSGVSVTFWVDHFGEEVRVTEIGLD